MTVETVSAWRKASPMVLWVLLDALVFGIVWEHPVLLVEGSQRDIFVYLILMALLMVANTVADYFAKRAASTEQHTRWIRWGWYFPRIMFMAASLGMALALANAPIHGGSLFARIASHGRGVVPMSLMMSVLFVAKWAEVNDRVIFGPPAGLVGLPGARIASVLEFLFKSESYVRIVEPEIAEMHREYFDALFKGRAWKARFALARGHSRLIVVLLAETPVGQVLLAITERISKR